MRHEIRVTRFRTVGVCLSSVVLLLPPAQQQPTVERLADFSTGIPSSWQHHSFAGVTKYESVEVETGRRALRATAVNSASALGIRLQIRPESRPIVRWRWRVDRLPSGGDESTKAGDDAAARVLLVFHESVFPSRVKTICYLWASTLRQGGTRNSVYSTNVKLIAVESGGNELNRWKTEERNYAADYERLFGERPDALLGLSIMTDSDNTHSTAVAYYDFIELYAGVATPPRVR